METINIFKHEPSSLKLEAGDVLYEQGEPAEELAVVQAGELQILLNDEVIETVGVGGLVGEMSLVSGSKRSATVRARTDCALVTLTEEDFLKHVHVTPFFALQVLRIAVGRLGRMNERLEGLS